MTTLQKAAKDETTRHKDRIAGLLRTRQHDKKGSIPCLGKKSLGKTKFGKENFGDHVLEIFVPKLSNTFKIFQLLVKFFQVLVKFFQVLVNFFLTL